jgi:hypothetical protein
MNFIQGGGFGNQNPNQNYNNVGQVNSNYGFNQNNKPPIPFSGTNVNRNIFILCQK